MATGPQALPRDEEDYEYADFFDGTSPTTILPTLVQ